MPLARSQARDLLVVGGVAQSEGSLEMVALE